MKYFSFLFYILLSTISYSQNPSYFIIGESEFKNADIYSVLETENQKLYISTSKGLYEYRHGKVNIIPSAKNQKGTDVFNLVQNSKNEVYCVNLSGQIFKVEDNRLKFHFQIPKKYYREDIEIDFDDADRLIVSSKGCIVVTNKGYEEIFFSKINNTLKLNKLLDKTILISFAKLDSIIEIKNGKTNKIKFKRQKPTAKYQILELDNKLISSTQLVELIKTNRPQDYLGYYQISKNEIWKNDLLSGIEIFEYKNEKTTHKTNYFSDTFISTIATNKKGSIYIGTFGQGLFVIPNVKTTNYSNIIKGNNPQRIKTNNNGLFISDKVLGLLYFDTETNKTTFTNYRANKLFPLKKFKPNIIEQYPNLLFSFKGGFGDIKNVIEIDSATILLATSLGLIKSGPKKLLNPTKWEAKNRKTRIDSISRFFDKRCIDLALDEENNLLYVSSLNSLKVINAFNEVSELKFNNSSIFANDLIFEGKTLICATQNFGILFFKNDHLYEQLSIDDGLGSNYVNKFEKVENRLFISHRNGFQIYDLETKKWNTIGTAEGIVNGSIKDFSISKDKIWFISNNQIVSYTLSELKEEKPDVKIVIDSIQLNKKTIFKNGKGVFNYDENELSFFVSNKGLLSESESHIEYHLTGTVEKKNRLAGNTEVIDFAYLPPGNYKFSLTTSYRNYNTPAIIYKFQIKKPFWHTWWFYFLSIIFFLSGISLFFIYKNKKTRKNNKEKLEREMLKTELITSQLKALRSQMNPHFIFNSLNSIQNLILKENTEASYDYIVLFSDLVRNALKYSEQGFICIENEISFIKTYLKLENLRFGEEFKFSISYKGPNDIFLPSLIVQPFVENAIVHGLFHKKGEKKLDIKFAMHDSKLSCIIIDNGIGRKKAREIKNRQYKNNDSFAINSISKRLKILNNQYGEDFNYQIFDLVDGSKILGTRVEVILPILDRNQNNY